jgi:hypothetical protein
MIIVVALAAIFSSFNLWLLDSWTKYLFFVFEIFTIIVLYLILNGYDFKLGVLKRIEIKSLDVHMPIIDVLLIVSAASLLLLNVLHAQGGSISLVLALFTTSILPGYALLNVFGLNHYFSKLENIVLSYVLSYAFTGFMTLVLLFASENTRVLCVLSGCILLGSISALKHGKQKPFPRPKSLSRRIDSLAILVAIAFFTLSFCLMYPGFALLPETDISQHYGSSIILNRTPDLYIGSGYLLAHLHESTFIALSNPSLISAQMALLVLNLFLILAFYMMAKQWLEKIDARLPSVATIFWVLFANGFGGFSWLYFAYLKMTGPYQTQLQLLYLTADGTYNGTIYGILGLWYVPATVSFVVLMGAIFILGKKEIPSGKYFALFSTVIVTLCLTHVVEAVVLAVFLALYWILSKNTELKTDLALKASAFGFVLVAVAYYIFSQFDTRFILSLPLLLSLALPMIFLALSLSVRKFGKVTSPKFKHARAARFRLRSTSKILVLLIALLYFVALLSSISLISSFHTAQVDAIGVVPWYMYPLGLGITGLLSMVALYYITEKEGAYKSLSFFIAFMIFAFIAGELVSIMNLYFFNVNYWEKRFIWFIKLPLALLAPIPILLLIDRLRKRFSINNTFRAVASVALIGTICLYGISTTFLNVEYWNITATNAANHPSQAELDGISALKRILDNDPRAWLATVTGTSAASVVFAGPADTLGLRQLLYTASTPEMGFTQLYRDPAYAHPYVYLDERDANYLSQFGGQFLAKYLLVTPVVFNNSEVTTYNLSKPSFPQSESQNVLIVPFDGSIQQNSFAAYCMLSNGFYNYTVMYDLDHNSLNGMTAVLSFDPPEGNISSRSFQDNFNDTLDSWSVLQGTWKAEEGHLVGGENGKFEQGVLLSQVLAENFTATVKVKPLGGDTTVANYADIVYSWVDPENYRIAEINFSPDSHVYVLFRNYVNGVETDSPNWPGSETALKWNFGDEYSLKLTVNGTLNELSINDTQFLASNSGNLRGKIGLHYYRFFEVSFDNFSVNYDTELHLRPVGDYVNYLNSGHKLVVLNTNGGGFFTDALLSTSNSTIFVQQIKGNATELQLPFELPMSITNLKDNSVRTLSYYTGVAGESPFVLQKDYDNGGELFYVNLQPIIQAMQTSSNQSAFYDLIGKLLDGLNLAKSTSTTPLSSFNGYVKEIRLRNNATIQTDSLLFPIEVKLENVEVREGNSSFIFYNVTSIAMSNYSRAIIETDNAVTQDGNGLYAEFQVNSTFSIWPSSGSIDLKITANHTTYDVGSVNSLLIKPTSSVQLQVRMPTVSALGVAFTEFYLQNYRQLTTQINGQNLDATGLTEFSIMISDNYKAISNLSLGSSFQLSSETPQYDPLASLSTGIFWFLILLPVFLGALFIFEIREPPINSKSATNEGELPNQPNSPQTDESDSA